MAVVGCFVARVRIPRAAMRAQPLQHGEVAAKLCGREGVAADDTHAPGPIAALLAEVPELLEVAEARWAEQPGASKRKATRYGPLQLCERADGRERVCVSSTE
jgi:hypothetical protein